MMRRTTAVKKTATAKKPKVKNGGTVKKKMAYGGNLKKTTKMKNGGRMKKGC